MTSPHDEVTHIGDRRELMADDSLIDRLDDVALTLHRPTPKEVVLVHDRPWEGNVCFYHTVLYDNGKYQMYYRGAHYDDIGDRSIGSQVVCYAESDDGISWNKPDLGLFSFDGDTNNNIIWDVEPESHNFSPFIDANPNCPSEQRYKALGGGRKRLHAFQSSDGIHWSLIQKDPVITEGAFDSQNLAFWDTNTQQYRSYFRDFKIHDGVRVRDIMTSTSDDFLNWSTPEWLEYSGAPAEHLYTNQVTPYFRAPHIYLALAKRFFPKKAALDESVSSGLVDNPKYAIASSDSIFMSTRGGKVYDRSFMEAFIRPGDTTLDWVARDNTPALGLAEGDGRRLYIYRMSHYAQPSAHLDRYSLRLDGFVSVNASYEGGELLSKSFRFSGGELEINYESSAAGELRVELLDLNGDPILGYGLDDCLPIFGNEIERVVKWKDGSDVSALAGKAVKLRIALNDADLYSFRFR